MKILTFTFVTLSLSIVTFSIESKENNQLMVTKSNEPMSYSTLLQKLNEFKVHLIDADQCLNNILVNILNEIDEIRRDVKALVNPSQHSMWFQLATVVNSAFILINFVTLMIFICCRRKSDKKQLKEEFKSTKSTEKNIKLPVYKLSNNQFQESYC